jgi:hypothetical protein
VSPAKRFLTTVLILLAVHARGALVWPQASERPSRAARPGIVFIVDGIGGFDVLRLSAQLTLPLVGVHHELRDFVWTHGKGQLLKDLQDTRYLVGKANELAALIRWARVENPERPIYLMARSAGTGLALRAAEQLPPGTLERIILLSAAISPTYDLRGALRATRGEIVSFYSGHDQLILNWGTRQFGTVDRVYGPSAGLRGFVAPRNLDGPEHALYHRLVQVPWNPRMLLEGNAGTHSGTILPGFLGKEVAPWLRQ